jgi:hypothetical protein
MPTVLRDGPYRFFFYAGDRNEPLHVHVERDENVAKYWLDPVRLHSSGGFARTELARIEKIIRIHHGELTRAWYGYYGDSN